MSGLTSRLGWMAAGAAVVAMGTSLVVGQVRTPAASTIKLVKPWSELTSLTDAQKVKIHDIHVKALAQINEIERQEKADIMVVLTDAQKVELKNTQAEDRKEANERRAANAAKEASAKEAGAAKPEAKGK